MSRLEITPAATWWQRRQFLNLPWTIYRGDPNWVPPLISNVAELVGYRRHPFYRTAEVQTYLALRDGRPVGRIAAIVNHAHNRLHNEKLGFFGFFESADDPQAAAGLFDAARAWLAGRGIERMRGPANPSQNYECGLLVEGFHSPPTFMMTYNPPYYARLIEACGFRKAQDLFAYMGHISQLETMDKKIEFITVEATRRFRFTVRKLDISRFDEEVRMFLNIYNQSLGGTWGFVPLSEAEIEHMSGLMRYLIVPEMTTVAEVDGRPVGAVFGMLDYNVRIKHMNGRLYPFGFLRLLWNRRGIKRVRFISTNVLPEYQRWGLGLVLLGRLVPDVLAWGIEEGEFSWVLESNKLSRGTLERGGTRLDKTFRLYEIGPES
jgi:GNAT superfamily N-acetyltransferase